MVSRWLTALMALTGLLWASVAQAEPLSHVRLFFICETAESAEYVALNEWGAAMPEDCRQLGVRGHVALTQEAEVHKIVKVVALDNGRHVTVGLVYLPSSNYWGYSAGYTILYIS